MNTTILPLSLTINELNKTAKISALKALGNSCLGRAINSVRFQVRQDATKERNAHTTDEHTAFDKMKASHLTTDLDQRNNMDEDDRAGDTFPEGQNSEQPPTPFENARNCFQIYEWCKTELETQSLSLWDMLNTPKEWIDRQLKGGKGVDEERLEIIAKTAKLPRELLVKLAAANAVQERAELTKQKPSILAYIGDMQGTGSEDTIDTVDVVLQHQLGVAVTLGMEREVTRIITQLLKPGSKIDNIASIPLIQKGIESLTNWVNAWEIKHRSALSEARDAGRDLKTLH